MSDGGLTLAELGSWQPETALMLANAKSVRVVA